MGAKIKLWFINEKNLFKMMKYVALTMALLLLTWVFDHGYPELKARVPDQLLLSADVTMDFLSNISGVFLTISIFSFTTIVTVLNKYSSSVSPRMLQTFIDRTDVLGLFGIFISGFFYSIISILLLQNVAAEDHVMAGSFAIAYAIVAMIGFIVFAKQVLENIKISNIIEGVYTDCDALIDGEVARRESAKRYEDDKDAKEFPVLAATTGYLYDIQTEAILKALDGIKAEFTIKKRIGEYATEGESVGVLKLFGGKNLSGDEIEDLIDVVGGAMVINVFKNIQDDYHHGLVILTEISVLALSPGTKDPNTAVACVNKISTLLGKLLSTANQFIVLKEDGDTKIIYQSYSVEDELYSVFSQIIFYSGGDPLVTRAILQGLYFIYMMAGMSAKPGVKNYFDSSYDLLMANFSHAVHLNRFEKIRMKMDERVGLEEERHLA
ncbi:DUF2254 family protein [Aedoeadaptatus acetigenes]|uniref:DUF2254 family protein n=1 Tax=Aedoeadaptatus acetigenes TaxID=2981723 RepID=UPI0011DCE3AB|nr:DUF2254 family protein [Aedoeadaptatus acetigenes]MCU6787094.1 DUF2254 domain-containing protein [Aedoeadaptatus acetigenes]